MTSQRSSFGSSLHQCIKVGGEELFELLPTFETVTLSSFMLAALILNVTPGSDVLFSMASGVNGGPRNAISAAAGISTGSLIHVVLATLGLSAVLAAYPLAYDTIRYLGAAYLVYLAITTWRSAELKTGQTASSDTRRAFYRGFITNILNPKVALFTLAFLPQFANPAIGPIWQQMAFLGLLFSISGFIVSGLYGSFASLLAKRIKQASGTLNKISALVFGGLAAKLVID